MADQPEDPPRWATFAEEAHDRYRDSCRTLAQALLNEAHYHSEVYLLEAESVDRPVDAKEWAMAHAKLNIAQDNVRKAMERMAGARMDYAFSVEGK